MRSLLATAGEIEKEPGILSAEVLVGFGWADSPYVGSSVTVIAENDASLPQARGAANRLAQSMWDRRTGFVFDMEVAPTVDEAIDRALRASESTVFISDSGDNVTAGTPGDAPYFLSRLLAKKAPDAVFASIADQDAARDCFDAGIGATLTVSLGGKLDPSHGGPVTVTGVVEHLHRPDPRLKDAAVATLRVQGVRILITDIRKAFTRLDDFGRAGVEPLEHRLVIVKLGYLFPELRAVAPREILAFSPGASNMDLAQVPYRHIPRPIFPLDQDLEWQPTIETRQR
jgi:microcystin degradation protein MlrC